MEYISLEYIFFITTSLFVFSFIYNLKQRKIISALQSYEESALHHSFYDALTELPNRDNIEVIITEHIHIASRHAKSFCTLVIKANDYKKLKEHSVKDADKLSCKIADAMLASTRDEDTVARVSPEHYIVVFNEYLELEHYQVPLSRIEEALSGINVSYARSIYPQDARSTTALIDGLLKKV